MLRVFLMIVNAWYTCIRCISSLVADAYQGYTENALSQVIASRSIIAAALSEPEQSCSEKSLYVRVFFLALGENIARIAREFFKIRIFAHYLRTTVD